MLLQIEALMVERSLKVEQTMPVGYEEKIVAVRVGSVALC